MTRAGSGSTLSLDYLFSLNLAGSASTLVAAENDSAQNPFNLNAEHGPSLFETVHLSLFKYFVLGESARLQFRAEFLNTLNHANLGLPKKIFSARLSARFCKRARLGSCS